MADVVLLDDDEEKQAAEQLDKAVQEIVPMPHVFPIHFDGNAEMVLPVCCDHGLARHDHSATQIYMTLQEEAAFLMAETLVP